LAIAGHVIIALFLLLGFFERTEPASVAAMPVEIVMEVPAAASTPPVSAPNEQNGLPSIPAVADADKRAKAPLATLVGPRIFTASEIDRLHHRKAV
jgi:hypothetical protein